MCNWIFKGCGDLDEGDESTCLSIKFPMRMRQGDCGCGDDYPNGDKPDYEGRTIPEPDPEPDWDTGDAG